MNCCWCKETVIPGEPHECPADPRGKPPEVTDYNPYYWTNAVALFCGAGALVECCRAVLFAGRADWWNFWASVALALFLCLLTAGFWLGARE